MKREINSSIVSVLWRSLGDRGGWCRSPGNPSGPVAIANQHVSVDEAKGGQEDGKGTPMKTHIVHIRPQAGWAFWVVLSLYLILSAHWGVHAGDSEGNQIISPASVAAAIDEMATTAKLNSAEREEVTHAAERQIADLRSADAKRALIAIAEQLPPDEAAAIRSAVWNRGLRVPVYWENASEDQLRNECEWIRQKIVETWERAADVKFLEWKPLPPNVQHGIRIKFADVRPGCMYLGHFIDGKPGGMVLNLTFHNWSPDCATDRKACIQKIAVHEFGHALGFAHEDTRSDTPASCRSERQGTPADYPVTVYDPSSVMNYCNLRWNNGGELSRFDKMAASFLYGLPKTD